MFPRSRFILSGSGAALRLGHTSALMALTLPAGFHALPLDEKRRIMTEAVNAGLDQALRCIDDRSYEADSTGTVVSEITGKHGGPAASEATAA